MTEITDKRLLRGSRARQAIARRGVDIASKDGLDGLSLGRLATDLGLSKSGIQTLYGSKEKLQLAVAETARDLFQEAVVRPALKAAPGARRLRALVDHWLRYATTPLFAGGCFWAANLPAFDDHPGPVRDALFGHHDAWLARLAEEFARTGVPDPALAAFQLDAALMAANTSLRRGATEAPDQVRRTLECLLS